ncbi:MAG: hypothetical protein KGL39_15020 [Patescibacteria group bacterium]|nr:hypothetical protein [Patescibacteria group bacterium]
MKRKLITVDFDGVVVRETVCRSLKHAREATPNNKIIKKVNDLFKHAFIVIYTARQDRFIPATLEWLRVHNVRYHAFSNLKIPADYYVDDHAMLVKDFLNHE